MCISHADADSRAEVLCMCTRTNAVSRRDVARAEERRTLGESLMVRWRVIGAAPRNCAEVN